MFTRLLKLASRHPKTRPGPRDTGSTTRLAPAVTTVSREGELQPATYSQKSLVLGTALIVYRRLREAGETVDRVEFLQRFSRYQKSLERLLDVEDLLGRHAEGDDPFPRPGESFLGFEVQEELGTGALARVYLAKETALGNRSVVIKVSLEGFAEAATLGKLSHPNIVRVYSISQDEASGMTAVCMPYQGGATLTDLLDFHRSLSAAPRASHILQVAQDRVNWSLFDDEELCRNDPPAFLLTGNWEAGVAWIGWQLADALNHAHSHLVLHRDLKPSNVLLAANGRPMLLDFNLSFDEAIGSAPLGGTLPYMAPEQIRRSLNPQQGDPSPPSFDPRGDVFSLGVILYELLTGILPFGAPHDGISPTAASLEQLNHQEAPPARLEQLVPGISPSLAATLHRCLEVDPALRFADMRTVAVALKEHFAQPQALDSRNGRSRRNFLATAGVAASVGGLLAGGFISWQHRRAASPHGLYGLGIAAYEQRQYAEARKRAQEAHALQPDLHVAQLLQAASNLHLRTEIDKTNQDLQQLRPRLTDSSPEAAAALADCLGCAAYLRQDFGTALLAFEDALRFRPNDRKLIVKCVSAGLRIRNDAVCERRAQDRLQRLLVLAPRDPEALLLRATRFRSSRDQQSILQDLKLASDLGKDSVEMQVRVANHLVGLSLKPGPGRELLSQVLTQAVHLGLSSTYLSDLPERLREEVWFQDLRKLARKKGKYHPIHSLNDPLLPSYPLPVIRSLV